MIRRPFALVGLVAFAGVLALPSCSESTPEPTTTTSSVPDGGVARISDVAVPCLDTTDSIYADPGALPADKGAIIKCAKDPDVDVAALQAKLTAVGYTGKAPTSGAQVYRILFRTERGDTSNTPGTSSAAIYFPTNPSFSTLPLIVGGRGTRGQGPACASSKALVSTSKPGTVDDDYFRLVLPIVGAGLPIIVPDLAGYANYGAANNPPSGYAQAADVGKSMLDATRALHKVFPLLDSKVVIVGHSQGGHSALAALSMGESYGAEGPIAGVAAYAPLWLSQRSWGALLDSNIADQNSVTLDPPTIGAAVTIWYHYTQAELLDGAGEGVKLFKADKQAAVKSFIDNACTDGPFDSVAGNKFASDLFDPNFANAISTYASFGSPCPAGNDICTKWLARYSNDRPHLTGKARTTPMFVLYGGSDTTIPPGRMRCAVDRLKADGAAMSFCFEQPDDHHTILNQHADLVADWIKYVALGAPAPTTTCGGSDTALTAPCSVPPPND